MRDPNVRIVARKRGKITAVREVHNVWTLYGRQWLAELVSTEPAMTSRIKYFGFGMGGRKGWQGMAATPPLSDIFPVASAPHGTNGFTYRDDFPVNVESLELPVPITATTTLDAYTNSSGLDWRSEGDLTDLYQWATHPSSMSFRVAFTARLGTPFIFPSPLSGDQYPFMPLSEAGLFLNDADPDEAFEPPVAYATFDTIQISEETDFFVEWDVVF